MRLEGDEVVEQGLDHIGPLVLVAPAAGAEIADRQALAQASSI